ncbi:MAG: GNAT family N-acetyltransferase, partial [Mesorhizobium sp.]
YSIIDKEWPDLRTAYEAWLDPANFDSDGQQRRRLEDIRAEFGA